MFIFFKTKAMSMGSLSITTFIGNTSLLISIFVSHFVWKEPIGVWDIFGLTLLLIAIFLSTFKKSEDGYSSSWKYYVSFFFVSAASVGLTFKAFGKSSASHFSSDMMAVSALVMVVFCLITVLLGGGFSIKQFRCGSVKKFIAAALISGALSCAYNRLNIFLSANVDAIIFFPFFNGGVCLLSAVMGIIMCKDKLSKEQFSGIALGIIAICIIGIL